MIIFNKCFSEFRRCLLKKQIGKTDYVYISVSRRISYQHSACKCTIYLHLGTKALESSAFSRVFCYLARSERTSKNPVSSFRDIHTRMTVNQHCPEKINSTGGDKRRSLWYNGAEYKKGGT